MKRIVVALLMITLMANQAMGQFRIAATAAPAGNASVARLLSGDTPVITTTSRVCLRKLLVRAADDRSDKFPATACGNDHKFFAGYQIEVPHLRWTMELSGPVTPLPQRYTGAVFRPPIA